MSRETYRIVRFYRTARIRRRTLAAGLTLAQVQLHCNHPNTSSTTAKDATGQARTRRVGDWFDGYEKE